MSVRVALRVRATAEGAWALSEELEAAGALSVSLEPLPDSAPQLEPAPGSTPLWAELELRALFEGSGPAARIVGELRERGLEPVLEDCPERDWVALGRAGLEPRLFADRLWVVPDWCDPPADGKPFIRLAPGLAFGTGTHPSTALCLEWIVVAGLRGKRVIDYGAGSGILALAAARLGAAPVTAVDNEAQALEATRANAGANALEVDAVAPEALGPEPADVVVANILARPLVALSGELLRHTRPGGRLVLSGITREQADVVAAAYAPVARLAGTRADGDWVCLELQKS